MISEVYIIILSVRTISLWTFGSDIEEDFQSDKRPVSPSQHRLMLHPSISIKDPRFIGQTSLRHWMLNVNFQKKRVEPLFIKFKRLHLVNCSGERKSKHLEKGPGRFYFFVCSE